jgi:hypothetical protein
MNRHIYSIGQDVSFGAEQGTNFIPAGTYTITRLLPPVGVNLQYRVRSERELHERVVVEQQIKAAHPRIAGSMKPLSG